MKHEPPVEGAGSGEPIAIVGMACVFPGAPDVATFWRNILDGVDAVGEAPPDWCGDLFHDPDSSDNDRIYTKSGGFLRDLAVFDALRHGVMPSSIDGGEPDQFLALQVAAEAVEDAGLAVRPVPGDRVAVILGRGTYINRGFMTVVQHGVMVDRTIDVLRSMHPDSDEAELAEVKRRLKASLPPFNAEMAPALVPNLVTGRISNRLDFRGTNYIVDAACASSLIALERGVADLRAGRCDLALVGGVHASTPPPIYQIFCQLEALSRSSRIRPFSAEADGTLLGEGVGILCVKRLSDAEAAGDRIYALVRSVGVASDGKGLGVLAPRIEGEALALERAYLEGGVSPATVGLVEAHGTATAVGDATEVEALVRVFGERRGIMPHCALGSVKSMIGHCLPAAGAAGLIKTAMALHHRTLPPTLVETPNPDLGLDRSPFYLNTEARPWVHAAETPRRAGVNAFGFGGINAHAVLEEYRGAPDPEAVMSRPSEPLLLAAPDAETLLAAIASVAEALRSGAGLRRVAAESNAALGDGDWRVGIVAAHAEDAVLKLDRAAERIRSGKPRLRDRKGLYLTSQPLAPDGALAAMFPGEGSQYPNMLSGLLLHFPEMRAWFDTVDAAFADHPGGQTPSQIIFPPPGFDDEGDALWRMDLGPAAIFAANQAVAALYSRIGLVPDMLVGHSTGEYSALYRAGVTAREDPAQLRREMRALNAQYEILERQGKVARGALIAVGAVDHDRLVARLAERDDVFLAMDNCPNQKVLAVLSREGQRWVERVTAELGGIDEPLPFDRAYHSPAFAPFSESLREFLGTLEMAPPSLPVWSCLQAAPLDSDPDVIRQEVAGQFAGRVRFAETIERMYESGARIFVECGPRNNLCAFVEDVLRKRPHRAVALEVPGRTGLDQLHHLIAQLAVERVPLDLASLGTRVPVSNDAKRSRRPIVLKTGLQPMRLEPTEAPIAVPHGRAPTAKPFQPAPGLVAEAPRAPASLSAPAAPPAAAVTMEPSLIAGTQPAVAQASAPNTVVGAYFDTLERLLESERDILEAFFEVRGGFVAAPPTVRAEPGASRFPMLSAIDATADGTRLVAQVEIDPRAAPYLTHHSFGREVSTADPALTGLMVVPLTFSMEVLAEAAAALRPALNVTGMREVRASRWIALDGEPMTLEVTAEIAEEGPQTLVRVRLREAGASALRPVILEAGVELAASRARPPAAEPRRIPVTARWSQQDIYERIMFHGPALQAVESMDIAEAEEVGGRLLGLPHDALLDGTDDPSFETDAVTLDAVGQLVGVWAADRLREGFHIFPFRVERLEIFRGRLMPGESARCHARVHLSGADEIRSDIEVVTGDGRLQCRIEGWWDKRFDLPERFFRARLDPRRNRVARELPLPGALARKAGIAAVVIDDLDEAFLESSGGIWPRVLAGLTLSRSERIAWRRIEQPARRLEWLLGRASAKDAVRLLRPAAGAAADIPVPMMAEGPPAIGPGWPAALGAPPHLSISHCGRIAAAVAADPAIFAGIGIDIERVAARDESFLRTAFSGMELQVLDAVREGPERDLLACRLWAAKEAAAKAFGADLCAVLESFEAAPDLASPDGIRVTSRAACHPGPIEVAATEIAPGLVGAIACRPLPINNPADSEGI